MGPAGGALPGSPGLWPWNLPRLSPRTSRHQMAPPSPPPTGQMEPHGPRCWLSGRPHARGPSHLGAPTGPTPGWAWQTQLIRCRSGHRVRVSVRLQNPTHQAGDCVLREPGAWLTGAPARNRVWPVFLQDEASWGHRGQRLGEEGGLGPAGRGFEQRRPGAVLRTLWSSIGKPEGLGRPGWALTEAPDRCRGPGRQPRCPHALQAELHSPTDLPQPRGPWVPAQP